MDDVNLDEVLRRASRRDPAALAELVERYGGRVFGLLHRLTGAPDAAEDLMQETFLRVVRTIGQYEHVGKFESWLFRIAANLARDRARRLKRHPEIGPLAGVAESPQRGEPAAGSGEPSAAVEQREAGARLSIALSQLSDAEREIIVLRHYSALSFREIADVLKIPLGTALARAHRALQRLRELMGTV